MAVALEAACHKYYCVSSSSSTMYKWWLILMTCYGLHRHLQQMVIGWSVRVSCYISLSPEAFLALHNYHPFQFWSAFSFQCISPPPFLWKFLIKLWLFFFFLFLYRYVRGPTIFDYFSIQWLISYITLCNLVPSMGKFGRYSMAHYRWFRAKWVIGFLMTSLQCNGKCNSQEKQSLDRESGNLKRKKCPMDCNYIFLLVELISCWIVTNLNILWTAPDVLKWPMSSILASARFHVSFSMSTSIKACAQIMLGN